MYRYAVCLRVVEMKLLLDFVHNDSNSGSCDHDDDMDGPLQLIRPMPDELRDYVTTRDYEKICIQNIDPLLEALYEMEKSAEQQRSTLTAIVLVLFIGMFSVSFLADTDLMFEIIPLFMWVNVCNFLTIRSSLSLQAMLQLLLLWSFPPLW